MEFRLDLDRFRSAHAHSYEIALQEIKAGKKQCHWMWYIFPQLLGLGHSTEAMYYAIQDIDEAVRYWDDPVLHYHMIEICRELLKLDGPIDQIMGYPDNLKLQSCMTLFYLVTDDPIFWEVLEKFYGGKLDDYTVNKLPMHLLYQPSAAVQEEHPALPSGEETERSEEALAELPIKEDTP